MKLRAVSAVIFGILLVNTRATTFTTTTTNDAGPGSLRQAILDANALPGTDSIAITAVGTINLASPLPQVSDNVTIQGPGAGFLAVSGTGRFRVLDLLAGTTNLISGLSIIDGQAPTNANGGGICNLGTLSIANCKIANNRTFGGFGGAIYTTGNLTLRFSTICSNIALGQPGWDASGRSGGGGGGAGLGGGIYTAAPYVGITNCSIEDNAAIGGSGGAGAPGPYNLQGNGGMGGGAYGGSASTDGGFGGGGGGGTMFFGQSSLGGAGGFGGGGGGGANGGYSGGTGGFGGGNAGRLTETWIGGNGYAFAGGGGGGAGIGSGIFAASGNVAFLNVILKDNRVQGGGGGSGGLAGAGQDGSGIENDIYVSQGAVTTNYNPIVLVAGRPVHGTTVTNRGPAQVSIESTFITGSIFYTLNGSTPSLGSDLYDGPLTLRKTAILKAITFSADFTQSNETFAINVVIQPYLSLTTDGGGSAQVTPADGPWPEDMTASITATPASGWAFLGWLGDDASTNASIPVPMNRDKSLKAVFGTTLTASPVGAGSVLIDPSAALLPYDTTVRLTAVPQPGSYFVTWAGAASGTANPTSLMVTSATATVSAAFTTLPAGKASLTVISTGNGHVGLSPRANSYTLGEVVNLSAAPEPGQAFLGWSGDLSGSTTTTSITVNTNKTVTASFTTKPQINVTALDGLTTDGFRLSLTGELGVQYTFFASTNLQTWEPVGTKINTLGIVQVNDHAATNAPARFYRAIAQ